MVERGAGSPIAVLPGIQGRWEWMTPTVDALTEGHRVLSWSLGELRPELDARGSFLAWLPALDRALDRAQVDRVAIVGVSFGGLIAASYAAHRPERVRALILVSTPAPAWPLRFGDAFCMRLPRLAMPFFGLRAATRLAPELYAARDSWPARTRLVADHAGRLLTAPFQPRYSAQWVREWLACDLARDCGAITAPTLLVTGDAALDRVVPVEQTREYLRLIPGSTHVTLPGTGHLGVITNPDRFAAIALPFIDAADRAAHATPPAEERVCHAS